MPAAPDEAEPPPQPAHEPRIVRVRRQGPAVPVEVGEGVFVQRAPAARAHRSDPTFALLILFALNIGLASIVPENGDLRFTALWGLMGLLAASTWVLRGVRVERTRLSELAVGAIFGGVVGLPLLLFGGTTLETTARLLFRASVDGTVQTLPQGTVLAYLVLIMPLAETLFFRGVMQEGRSFLSVGAAASVWSILLCFPMLEVVRFPGLALLIGVALVVINLLYSYVRERNGLAAAWLCQVVLNIMLLYLPYWGLGVTRV